MPTSRRDFVALSSLGLLGAALPAEAAQAAAPQTPPPGAPPAFGTAPAVGPEVKAATFQQAEKLMQVEMTPPDLAQAASNWQMAMAPLYERRVGPRKVELDASLAPASQWNPTLPGTAFGPRQNQFVRSVNSNLPLPAKEDDLAFASVAQLSRWI